MVAWLLLAVACAGTWATAVGPGGSVGFSTWESGGLSSAGILTLLGGTVVLVALRLGRAFLAAVVAGLMLILMVYVILALPNSALQATAGASEASLGWGAWLAAGSVLVLTVWTFKLLRDSDRGDRG